LKKKEPFQQSGPYHKVSAPSGEHLRHKEVTSVGGGAVIKSSYHGPSTSVQAQNLPKRDIEGIHGTHISS